MDKETRHALLNHYRSLPKKDRARLDAEAVALRNAPPKFAKAKARASQTDDAAFRAKLKAPLEDFLLEILQRMELHGDQVGTVVSLSLGRATIEVEGERHSLALLPKLADESNEGGIAVGDRVTFDENFVRTVLKRRTWLGRTDPGTGQVRAIVANVDVVVIVVSVVAPPLHPRIIDRYLIGIRRGGAEPVIAVNKVDLGEEELPLLDPYRVTGITIIPVSANKTKGIDELKKHLEGKVCAFVGHSGVGKSSLVNALMPEANQDTGSVSEGYGRGTHTTTASSTFDLGNGTRLIDTPGIRAFGLGKLTMADLVSGFPEFLDHPCGLRNCSHTHEPNCGVKDAINLDKLSRYRYETYLGLLEQLG